MISTAIDALSASATPLVYALAIRHGGKVLDHAADIASLTISLRGTKPDERADIIKALASWRKR